MTRALAVVAALALVALGWQSWRLNSCLLYTSDAADEL